jgi:Transposase DDE domain
VTKKLLPPAHHSIEDLPEILQTLFTTTANQLALETKFIKRKRTLSGSSFAQTLVLGWLNRPAATLSDLAQCTARCRTPVKPQSLNQRFTQSSVDFMRQLLQKAVCNILSTHCSDPSVYSQFSAVILTDSTIINLPAHWQDLYPGCGNQAGSSAGLKVQVSWDCKHGALLGIELQAARDHDRTSSLAYDTPSGALVLRDLGYFKLSALREGTAKGSSFISRIPVGSVFFADDGAKLTQAELLIDGLDRSVWLGEARVPARLLVLRLPEEVRELRLQRLKSEAKRRGQPLSAKALLLAAWDIRVTNISEERLSGSAVFALFRTRWQVELLFKLWKSVNLVDESRSTQPYRVLSEIFGKLLGCVVQHWCILACAWQLRARSLVRVARAVQAEVMALFYALGSIEELRVWVSRLAAVMVTGCEVQRRCGKPSAFQVLSSINP